MTISTSTSRSGPYAGAGTTGPFTVGFRFLENSHLRVVKTLLATGVETVLTLSVDYTVTGAGGSGGAVTTTAPVTSDYSITIVRAVPYTQETDYTQSDPFPAQSHEDALDKLTMLAQQLKTSNDRALRVPEEIALPDLPPIASRANMLLAFDSSGNPSVFVPVSGSAADVLTQLANTSDATKGLGMIGLDVLDVPPEGTGAAALNQVVRVFDWLTPTQKAEARSGAVTLDMSTQIQAALTAAAGRLVDFGPYTYLATGLTVPISTRAVIGTGTIKCQANSTTVMTWPTDTTRSHARWFGGGLKIDANGKTGATGVAFGSVTNNPSAGAREAVLYMGVRDLLVTGFETNMDSRVSMEHVFSNVVLKSGTVGLKLYGDPSNGGGNSNSFNGLRLQGNQVGAIIKNTSSGFGIPVHNNNFDGLLLQENTVCGMAFIGCGGQAINTVHIEGNGSGAASVTVDGYVIPKCDIHMDASHVMVSGTDLATSLSPSFNLTVGSRLTSDGLTGYGVSNGDKVRCDATSTYYELGPVSGIGVSGNLAAYGQIVSVQGLAAVHGAPLIAVSRGSNRYAGNPMYPDVTNAVGVVSLQNQKSEFGLTPEVTFAASVGNTGTNRLQMSLMTCVALKYNISSFLVMSSANGSFALAWRAGANQLNTSVTLTAGKWKRVAFISFDQADHTVFIYPTDTAGASLQVQGVQSTSGDLEDVSTVYSEGQVNVATELYNRGAAAPTTGTWAVGDVVWQSAPAAGGFIGFVCTTGGTPGTWKTFGAISA